MYCSVWLVCGAFKNAAAVTDSMVCASSEISPRILILIATCLSWLECVSSVYLTWGNSFSILLSMRQREAHTASIGGYCELSRGADLLSLDTYRSPYVAFVVV